MSDLRERVAKAMCDAVNVEGTWEETGTLHREKVWLTAADAAIAISRADALEEAARVADAKSDEWDTEWRRGCKVSSHLEGMSDGAHDCAAAIRALKEGK